MKPVKTIATTAAFVLALSGYAFAQGSLGDSGTSGAARGSAVQSAPSAVESSKGAVESSKGAVESSPSSGSGFGSTGSTRSSRTTPDGNPVRDNPAIENNGRTVPTEPGSR
jgi:hypothetical protein